MYMCCWCMYGYQKLASEFINDPLKITIAKGDVTLDDGSSLPSNEVLSANQNIDQTIEVIDEFKRDQRLIELLKQNVAFTKDGSKILVFVLYKKEVDKIERLLKSKGFNCIGMSSNKNQYERSAAIDSFKSATIPILIATDVRGGTPTHTFISL